METPSPVKRKAAAIDLTRSDSEGEAPKRRRRVIEIESDDDDDEAPTPTTTMPWDTPEWQAHCAQHPSRRLAGVLTSLLGTNQEQSDEELWREIQAIQPRQVPIRVARVLLPRRSPRLSFRFAQVRLSRPRNVQHRRVPEYLEASLRLPEIRPFLLRPLQGEQAPLHVSPAQRLRTRQVQGRQAPLKDARAQRVIRTRLLIS
jgi:hypothetical protein